MLLSRVYLGANSDSDFLLHNTSLQLSQDRGHLALVEGGTPSIPDVAETAEKADAK